MKDCPMKSIGDFMWLCLTCNREQEEEAYDVPSIISQMAEARLTALNTRTCPVKPFGCGMPVDDADFHDDLSRQESLISGMCQMCQDRVFGELAELESAINGEA
jgi:hypothetical protein